MKQIRGIRGLLALLALVMGCNLQAQEQTVADGDKFVVAICYNGQWYAMGQTFYTSSPKYLEAIKIQVDEKKRIVSYVGNSPIIWTNIKDMFGYDYLKSEGGKYVGYDGNVLLYTAATTVNYRWVYKTHETESGAYRLVPTAHTSVEMGANLYSGNSYFKCYSSSPSYCFPIYLLPLCKQDADTGAYTLQGTGWTAESFANLDLSAATSVDLRGITLPENLTASANCNPNCLFYVNEGETNAGNLSQVVKVNTEGTAGTAESIQLTDGHDFHTIIPFTATNITYTRHLCDGWSTLALPFTYILQGETCEAFAEATAESVRFTSVAEALQANHPYLIHRTATEDVTFSATEAEVPVTTSAGNCFKSNFHTFTMSNDENLYKLSSDGTTFNHSAGAAQIGAFRAFLDLSGTQSGSAAPKRVVHESAETPTSLSSAAACEVTYADGVICIRSEQAGELPLYRADGTLERMLQVQAGTNHYTLSRPGIYLMGGGKNSLLGKPIVIPAVFGR